MMDTIPPVPKPRVNTADSVCKVSKNSAKKPVPLPRLRVCNESNSRPVNVNSANSDAPERRQNENTSQVDDSGVRMQCNTRVPSKDLKEEWKIESSDAQLKGKSVLGRTKNVSASIEKSVRNIIARRLTVRSQSPNKSNELSVTKFGRSQSLPSEDIFQSISFHSPLVVENAQQEVVIASEDALEEDACTSGAPPPEYPPPPLPDESVYDEVVSVVSSHSSGHDSGAQECDSVYEDVTLVSRDHNRPTSRSDSWSFYDSTPDQDIYQNDIMIYNRDCGSTDSDSHKSVNVQNDLYINWEVCEVPKRQDSRRLKVPTKSVILEFDPLYEKAEDPLEADDASELLLFTESPYGKINRMAKKSEAVCPPVPPRRYDSITPETNSLVQNELEPEPEEEEAAVAAPAFEEPPLDQTDLPVTEDSSSTGAASPPGRSRRALVRWASMKKAIQMMTDGSSLRKSASVRSTFYGAKSDGPETVERPSCLPQAAVQHSGLLYRATSNIERVRDVVQRRCVLAERKLSCVSDKTGSNDVIPLDKVLSVQFVPEHKTSSDGEDLHFFELSGAWKTGCYLFATACSTERRVWMQKIVESMTAAFPCRLLSEFTRAGWCYLKEGISGAWTSGWILIQKRTMFYCVQKGALQEADLRKARCVVLQDSKCEVATLSVAEAGPSILVDIPGQSLYLQMDSTRETTAWHGVIRSAAVDNGLHLAQQQLTREDVPTIIDKCINFVYAHGSMSEGIYRRSGANSSVTRLLTLFRQDAWAVQLTRQQYSEYDVASALKRFLRDLPEPLLTTDLHSQLCEIAAGKRGSHKTVHYRRVLEQLPPINYLTTRKLIGHLHFIHEQHEKNLMPVENLAAIWGPTLLHIEGADNLTWSKLESGVVSDLILLYSEIFEVDAAELSRDKRMQEVLERYHSANSTNPQSKPSGDLKIWIHIKNRDSTNCVNVTVGPQKLAGEVCAELASKMSQQAHELCLEEVVCGGALSRPLHHTERVLDVVLRWGYWSDIDRKDNCLVLCQNTVFREASSQAKFPMALCGDLRFADRKSRSFKTHLFEFSQAKLCYYKDKRGSVKLGEWRIEDIVWYLGHEPKRSPQMRWAVTFIDKHKHPERTKETPFFGCTIAGTSKEEQVKWIGAMLAAEYPNNLLPSPVLLQ
ncbi:arf-GAP with Rho-GAP domain, ANK repeat and PH domain-containing protein 1 [Periplaneta americana]|uniref:arf-GAP with Rho-GAP domain, ANK repeat and PH domain-containing protein 1 n=1 Tax=Periplaneta americana TaxID=6978 RepID=UPI0037E83C6F